MGVVYVEGTVTGPTGKKASVRFLVDSGATYTLLPERVWKEIELVPKRTATFTLADETTIERKISEWRERFPNVISPSLKVKDTRPLSLENQGMKRCWA